MSDDFGKLFQDLDLEELRVVRPSKFAFLCGGALGTKGQRSGNLRDYICRVRPMRLEHPVVLAEAANQLYRDTSYNDLITFEEDIARIAAIVVVTAESSGALAELGAFVSNETIRPSLRILLQERYEKEESFVRFGAPTSPALSNIIMSSLDAKFAVVADQLGIIYSRYADDITLSANTSAHFKFALCAAFTQAHQL